MPEPTSIVDFLQIKPEQRLAYYQAELAVLEQSKTTDSPGQDHEHLANTLA